MSKFGTLLNSRPTAREDSLRLRQIIDNVQDNEIVLDFSGVEIITPSYADELFLSLNEQYHAKKITIQNAETMIVKQTLDEIAKK
jgi:hypothetical protein